MYSYNCLIFYSILGFILESTIYKIKKSKRHSGISYGPVTYVYGFGILGLNALDKYFLSKIKGKKIKKLFITFLSSTILMSLIEFLGGIILYKIFQIRLWDYSNKPYHLGHYICLELSIIWGILGCLYLYFTKKVFDPLLEKIPKKISIALIIIQLIDIIFVIMNKFF